MLAHFEIYEMIVLSVPLPLDVDPQNKQPNVRLFRCMQTYSANPGGVNKE